MKFKLVPATAPNIRGSSRRQPTDHELSALASLNRKVKTKRHANLVLRHNGFSGAGVEALMRRVDNIVSAHDDAVRRHIAARLGHVPAYVATRGAGPVRLPQGLPAERLTRLRKNAVQAAAKACLRHGAAGGSRFNVQLVRDPRLVRYEVNMSGNRDTYAGAFKGWLASEDNHLIVVPEDWRVRVQRRGLARAGGMLTLDVHPLVGHGDVELFKAVWVAQSRGYGVKVHRGVIARCDGETYHADDVQSAIRGAKQKAKYAASPRPQPVCSYELSIEDFVRRYQRYSALNVSVDDARATGACEYGIEAWCHAVGIDMAQGQTSLRRVLDGFQSQPQIEVRRTVLHAIRRYRAERKLATEASRQGAL